jgi:hypothetical protein
LLQYGRYFPTGLYFVTGQWRFASGAQIIIRLMSGGGF